MMSLFKNEYLKIIRSRTFRVAFLISLLYVPFNVLTGGSADYLENGYKCPVDIYTFFGTSFFWIFGAMIAALVAGEYDNGTIRNAIGSGVSRRKYFASKIISLFITSAFILFFMVFMYFVVTVIRFTRWTGFIFTGEYLFKLLSYYLAMLILVLAYNSVFILFAQIFHGTMLTFLGVAGVTLIESTLRGYFIDGALWQRGPIGSVFKMLHYQVKGNMLSARFWGNLAPSIIIGTVALVVSYFLFTKRDIE